MPQPQPEFDALWELAGTSNERLRLRFVGELLRPGPGDPWPDRIMGAVHSAVGLDPQRRQQDAHHHLR